MNSDEMSVLSTILNHHQSAQPLLAVLVDPDKRERYSALLSYLGDVDLVLVGGSTGTQIEECVMELRHHTSAPLVLFPGNTAQFTPMADALLFLTLLNSRRAEVLIEPHIQVASIIRQSGIEQSEKQQRIRHRSKLRRIPREKHQRG